jgi:hypothetical protein
MTSTRSSCISGRNGAIQKQSLPLFGEDELGGQKEPMVELKDTRSTKTTVNKNSTPKELQDKMRCLITFHPQLWKEYKDELTKEPAPTSPETVRRVFIDFLNQHEEELLTESDSNPLEIPSVVIRARNNVEGGETTWKPGSTPGARRRSRTTPSLVNSLKDSLHRSLHYDHLPSTTQSTTKSVVPPTMMPSRRMPSRRVNKPLRQRKVSKPSHAAVESGSEHSTSSASFQ